MPTNTAVNNNRTMSIIDMEPVTKRLGIRENAISSVKTTVIMVYTIVSIDRYKCEYVQATIKPNSVINMASWIRSYKLRVPAL